MTALEAEARRREPLGWRWLLGVLLVVCVAIVGWRLFSAQERVEIEREDSSLQASNDGPTVSSIGVLIEGTVRLEREVGPELDPPPTCRVRVWQGGVEVARAVTCDNNGAYAVALPSPIRDRIAVEIEVPRRLRAMLETTVPTTSKRGRLPTVALGVAQSLAGHVVSSNGDALAGIVVEAMPRFHLNEPEPWRRTTDEKGQFVFDTLPEGEVIVRASAPDHAMQVLETWAPSTDVFLRLDRWGAMKGRVMGPAELVAAAEVRVEGSGLWPPRRVMTDAKGSFTVPDIPSGIYAIEATSTDRSGRRYASLPLENISIDHNVSLALIEAYGVPVEVRTREGTPIRDARVTVSNASLSMLQRVAWTDESGHAMVEPLVPGPYVARVESSGWLPSDPVVFTITDRDAEAIPIVLREPGQIAGVVVDSEHRPIAGATVDVTGDAGLQWKVSDLRDQPSSRSTPMGSSLGVTEGPVPTVPSMLSSSAATGVLQTRADGTFTVSGVAPGNVELWATHPNYAGIATKTVVVRPGVVASITLVLAEGEPLTGRVTDDNHQPIARAAVIAGSRSPVYTDERGVFDAGVHRGTVELTVRVDGYTPWHERVVLSAGGRDLELQLTPARARMTGRVIDDARQPVSDAQVTLQALDTWWPTSVEWTDKKGTWAFENLPVGRFIVLAQAGDRLETEAQVDLRGEADLELMLVDGWWLEVSVQAYGDDEPVAGALVEAGGERGITDARGYARLGPLDTASVRVRVASSGRAPQSMTVSRPPQGPGRDVATAAFALVTGGAIEGWVTDYRGDPVAGASVVVVDPKSGAELGQIRSDRRGMWSFAGLRAGDVTLVAEPPADRLDELAAVTGFSDILRDRVTRDVDLRLPRR